MRLPLLAAALFVLALPLAARADGLPPVVHHQPVTRAEPNTTVVFTARIVDADGVFSPTLYLRYVGRDPTYSQLPLARLADTDEWSVSTVAAGDFEYWLEVYDEFGNGPARVADAATPLFVRVGDDPAPAVAEAPDLEELPAEAFIELPSTREETSVYTFVGGGFLAGAALAAIVGTVSTAVTMDAADRWRTAGSVNAWAHEGAAVRSGATKSNVSWGVAGALAAVGGALVVAGEF